MKAALEKPTMDIAFQIRPPMQEGFLGALTSYIEPYVVEIKLVNKINKYDLLIPSGARPLDVFIHVKDSFEKDPSARLIVTDFFGVSPDTSTEMLKGKYLYMVEQWEELAEISPNQEVRVFARKILRILKKAYAISLMKPEVIGEMVLKQTGFPPKDPQQRKEIGKLAGTVLQVRAEAKARKELRCLLEEN